MISANEALEKLKAGNARYLDSERPMGDVSPLIRRRTSAEGQQPYAIVICCSDSRVIPEAIFSAGIGDLFVIRVAGNVIDNHQLGSIEYAADHLGSKLIVVLGHDHCGAVDAALNHCPDGYIKSITDEILLAVGDERDADRACRLNALHSVRQIEDNLDIRKMETERGLRAVAAIYHIKTGEVEFLS
ncbi:MAG: carbonic anhydrase [Eubacteriales bacterium]